MMFLNRSVTLSHRRVIKSRPHPTEFMVFGLFEVWAAGGGKFAVTNPHLHWFCGVECYHPSRPLSFAGNKWSETTLNQTDSSCL
jgi:hypothetical protein